MKIGFGRLWEVKVDDHIDSLNVDTSSEEVRANKVSRQSIPEIVENSVSVGLLHLGVRVETRVSLFGDLPCEKFNSASVVAEDDRLIDLQLMPGQLHG